MLNKKSNDGRWLVGWLVRLVGASMMVGLGIAAISILRESGFEVPRTTMINCSILGLIGLSLLGLGQVLMNSAPRSTDDRSKESL